MTRRDVFSGQDETRDEAKSRGRRRRPDVVRGERYAAAAPWARTRGRIRERGARAMDARLARATLTRLVKNPGVTRGSPSRTRTAASELDLEPLEVRVGLQGRVRALLSLPFSHVVEMPRSCLGARERGCAPERRPPLMNETKTSRVWRLMTGIDEGSFDHVYSSYEILFVHLTTSFRQDPN